jgi:hypothetical protein
MTTLCEFLKVGRFGDISCRSSRQELLAFMGAGFKTHVDGNEEIIHLHAFNVFLGRASGKGLEDGIVSGFGFYLAYGDIIPPHLAFPDFDLTPLTQATEIIQFMTDNGIKFAGDPHFTVAEGGVVLLHNTPKLTSLVFPCPGTAYWEMFIAGEPEMEKMLKRCHPGLY